MSFKAAVCVALMSLLLNACGVPAGALISDCLPEDGLDVVCDLQAPEDLALVPGDRYLLLSQFAGLDGSGSGSIALFDTTDRSVRQLFPDGAVHERGEPWGDASCARVPAARFSPHGTHLHRLDDGRWRYVVVNHGGGETLDLFELTRPDAPRLVWKGCVFAPDNTLLNDVVGLANGDLIFTQMFPLNDSLAMVKSMLGLDTGRVWRWSARSGLRRLPNTEGAMPNGIEISADNRHIFINLYMDRQVRKYHLRTQQVVGVAAVPRVDNSAWNPRGRLWLASHTGGFRATMACFEDPSMTCGARFEIVELDPGTMRHETVFSHRGAPMGAATVAVQAGESVYMGSYAGDRLLVVPSSKFR